MKEGGRERQGGSWEEEVGGKSGGGRGRERGRCQEEGKEAGESQGRQVTFA